MTWTLTKASVHKLMMLWPCHFWAHPISREWWHCIVLHTWDDDQSLDSFRMTRPTFHKLVQLGPHLERQPTTMYQPLPAETYVAISILKLAKPATPTIAAGASTP